MPNPYFEDSGCHMPSHMEVNPVSTRAPIMQWGLVTQGKMEHCMLAYVVYSSKHSWRFPVNPSVSEV